MYPEQEKYAFASKWSSEIAERNFTQVPNLLLACQGHLKLKDGELLTLLHLLTFQFSTNSQIYPTITTLTKFSHKGYSTVQRRLRQLEKKGYVKRRHRLGTSNYYDLTPCVEKLNAHTSVCTSATTSTKRGVLLEKVRNVPPSFLINKEYETLNIPTKEHVPNYEHTDTTAELAAKVVEALNASS